MRFQVIFLVAILLLILSCGDKQTPGTSVIDEPDAQVHDTEKKDTVTDEFEVTKEIETVNADRPKRTRNLDRDKELRKRIAPLYWLADHQNEDGSWSADFHKNCGSGNKSLEVKIKREGVCKNEDGSDDSGQSFSDELLTGLTLLTFLSSGYTHEDGEFRTVVKEGFRYLMKAQQEDGYFAEKTDVYQMMTHAICTFAIAEAYAMTANAILKRHSKAALKYIVDSQCKDKDGNYTGWSKNDDKLTVDPMATSWVLFALKSCRAVALEVPAHCWEGIGNYFKSITTIKDGVAETKPDVEYLPKNRDNFVRMPIFEAVYSYCLLFVNGKRSDSLYKTLMQPLKEEKNWISDKDPAKIDFMYWYFAVHAMGQYCGQYYKNWESTKINTLLRMQRTADSDRGKCVYGSWDPIDAWGKAGGRVYSTAMGHIILTTWFKEWISGYSSSRTDYLTEGALPSNDKSEKQKPQEKTEAEKKAEEEDWKKSWGDW